jgi:hypothetical protein
MAKPGGGGATQRLPTMESAPAVGHSPLAAWMTICGPRAGAAALARARALERSYDVVASALHLTYDLTVAASHDVCSLSLPSCSKPESFHGVIGLP